MQKPNKELLFTIPRKEFKLDTFCSGGNGGQNQNKVATGVRITHIPSGAVGESREERSQGENRKRAFKRLSETSTFKLHVNRRALEVISGKTLEQKVEESLAPENLLLEVKDEKGKWIQVPVDFLKEDKS